MPDTMKTVLIVGGYGHVGSRIAKRLLASGMMKVRIAGRQGRKADEIARYLGCEAVAIDTSNNQSWDAALSHVGMVISCIDQADTDFPAYVLSRGIDYIDISATDTVLAGIEKLHPLAQRAGACAVLSVGLAPGLTNLMAMQATENMDKVEKVTIGVLLGLGDDHGAAAVDWTLNNLSELPFSIIKKHDFGSPGKPIITIPFDFADQYVLARRNGLHKAETRLGFASPMVTSVSLWLMARMAQWRSFRQALRWAMAHIRLGTDRAALAVEASGYSAGKKVSRRIVLEGRAEAEITALVAAQLTLHLQTIKREAGVWHIQEILSLHDFSKSLDEENIFLNEA